MKTVIPAQKKSGLAQYPYYPVQQSYRDVRLSEVGSEINQNKYRTPIVIAIVLGFFWTGFVAGKHFGEVVAHTQRDKSPYP